MIVEHLRCYKLPRLRIVIIVADGVIGTNAAKWHEGFESQELQGPT